MITGGEDKCIPVPYYVRRRVAILSILKLRAEAGLRPKTPVIDSLMSGFAWLVGIMLVRWVAGPAHLIHVKLGVLKLGLRERDPVRNLVRERFAGLQGHVKIHQGGLSGLELVGVVGFAERYRADGQRPKPVGDVIALVRHHPVLAHGLVRVGRIDHLDNLDAHHGLGDVGEEQFVAEVHPAVGARHGFEGRGQDRPERRCQHQRRLTDRARLVAWAG